MDSKKTDIKASVKIPSPLLTKVKRHVTATKQTIGGFITLAIEDKLKAEKKSTA
jgi:hypothetical protein